MPWPLASWRPAGAAAAVLAAAALSSGWTPSGQPATSRPAAKAPAPIESLSWMAGCWQRPRPDGLIEEHWMAPRGGTMLGMSRTVAGARTAEHEFIRIETLDGVLSYVARPSRQAETAFALASIGEGTVVFANPAHDFPQRIGYRRNPDGSLTAWIEGTIEGTPRTREFAYRRCPG